MQHQDLLAALLDRKEEYQNEHSQTIAIDLEIAKAMSLGSSPTKVSIDVHCDISTVYRSIARIEQFLQTEPLDAIDVLKSPFIVSNAVTLGRLTHQSLIDMKLYFLMITLHQLGHNSVSCNEVRDLFPGIRNRCQREAILKELNALAVQTDEEDSKLIKIFEFVEYRDHTYHFELTEDAYPYYYPLYHLLGRHPQMPNPCK